MTVEDLFNRFCATSRAAEVATREFFDAYKKENFSTNKILGG